MKNGWLILTLSIPLLFACSESDINIPSKEYFEQPKTLVEIYSPINGSVLPQNTPFILEYEVIRGQKGGYIKIQVDKMRPVTIARIKGQHHIDGLPAGSHTIKISDYGKNKKRGEGQAIINITMQ